MNKIQNAEIENYLRMKLSVKSINPIGVIHEDPSMSTSWLKGKPLDGKKPKLEAVKIAKALETAEALAEELEAST